MVSQCLSEQGKASPHAEASRLHRPPTPPRVLFEVETNASRYIIDSGPTSPSSSLFLDSLLILSHLPSLLPTSRVVKTLASEPSKDCTLHLRHFAPVFFHFHFHCHSSLKTLYITQRNHSATIGYAVSHSDFCQYGGAGGRTGLESGSESVPE